MVVGSTGSRLVQISRKYSSSTGGWELLCVLVRKDGMAPNWRGICICIGLRKNALPVTTMDHTNQKVTKAAVTVSRETDKQASR